MTGENAEIVRRSFEALERDGVEAASEYWAPDVEFHEDPTFPEPGVYRGADEIAAYSRDFRREFAEFHYEPRKVVETGEVVLVDLRISGRGRGSGAEFEIRAWWAARVRGGKLTRIYASLDRERALAAVAGDEWRTPGASA